MITKKESETTNGFTDKLDNYLSPFGLDLEEKSKRILAGFMVIFTAPVLLVFSAIHLARADYPLGIFLLISGSLLAATITLLRKFKSVTLFSRIDIGLIGILFIFLLVNSGPHGYMAHWVYIYPLVAFFMLGRNEGLYYNIVFYFIILIYLSFQNYLSWTTVHVIEFKARFLVSLLLVNVLAYTFEFVRHKFKEGMEQNQLALEVSKIDAERANETKSEFLANMSHELRTPLNHIIGFTEVVVDGHFGELNHQQKEYLGDSLASSRHLLSLINDILDLSKVEAGKLELQPSTVDLGMLLENSMVMVKEKALKHGINLSCKINGIPETINADERKLKQVLYNLMSNAVKFTPDGGKISVTAQACNSSGVEICVSDTGIGVCPENMERIFSPFEQVEVSKSRKYQGTGLGLSLTKRLVELHGGKIWAESEGEGKGATFKFTISMAPKEHYTDSEGENSCRKQL